MRLKDKIAVVTGSGTGIGKAIAVRFAKEGAHVSRALDFVMCNALSDELDLPIQVPLIEPTSSPVFGAVGLQPKEPDVAYLHEDLCCLDLGLGQRSGVAVAPQESMPTPGGSRLSGFAPAE